MSKFEESDRSVLYSIQAKRIQEYIRERVENVKRDAYIAREEMIQRRAQKIQQAREQLNNTAIEIQARHSLIKDRLNQEAVFREASIRVNRGLEALEGFIQVLRDTKMEDEMLKKAVRDPIISSSLKSEATKILTSEFFRSIQTQLVMQTEFINIAAHELRTPIMPILVNVELLEEELGKNNPEIKIITRNAKRLQHLTENILSVARLESKTLTLKKEVFDLNELISNVLRDASVQIESQKLKIVHETKKENIKIEADKDKIAQIIYNMLHNAIKFTPDGVILIAVEVRGNKIKFSMKDSGKGIDLQIFPIIFSKFATKSDKGTGLGLYISKGIIDAHGGEIWAKNNDRPDKGATLSFTLPIKSVETDQM